MKLFTDALGVGLDYIFVNLWTFSLWIPPWNDLKINVKEMFLPICYPVYRYKSSRNCIQQGTTVAHYATFYYHAKQTKIHIEFGCVGIYNSAPSTTSARFRCARTC